MSTKSEKTKTTPSGEGLGDASCYAWTIQKKGTSGTSSTNYLSTCGRPVSAEHVKKSPSVIRWLGGDELLSIHKRTLQF